MGIKRTNYFKRKLRHVARLRRALEWYLGRYHQTSTPIFDSEMSRRFKIAREKSGLSQQKMAECLGLSQTDISRLESGKLKICGVPTAQFKTALGEHFGYFIVAASQHLYEEVTWRYDKKKRKIGNSIK